MTSSAGASGLIDAGSPPSSRTASRMVARSTTAGTPVKSCISTRAGVKAISVAGSAVASQLSQCLDVISSHVKAVFGAQLVLQEDLQAHGQSVHAGNHINGKDLVRLTSHLSGHVLAPKLLLVRCAVIGSPSPRCLPWTHQSILISRYLRPTK